MLELLDLLSQTNPSSKWRQGEQGLLELLDSLCQQLDCDSSMEEEGDKLCRRLDCNLATEEEEDDFALLGGRLSPAETR